MAPHSSTLAWKIPWMEEPGGLQSMGSHRVGYSSSSLVVGAGNFFVVLVQFLFWRSPVAPVPCMHQSTKGKMDTTARGNEQSIIVLRNFNNLLFVYGIPKSQT